MHSFLSVVSLLLISKLTSAHTTFTTLYVDGQNQGDGVCVRMNQDASKATFPIEPITSKNIACGYDGEKGVSRVCPVKASSTISFEFRAYPDGSQPGSIAPSHKGPCAIYMKKVPDATADDNAAGDGWFKIWESGYDTTAGKWCTEKMIDNNGHISVRVPAGIQAGYYLVRPELLALHSAANHPPDPQFYVGCAQIFVQGNGNAKPETVEIGEGTYDLSIPGMTFNIWDKLMHLPYPMFGPPVYRAGSSGGNASSHTQVPNRPAPSTAVDTESASPVTTEKIGPTNAGSHTPVGSNGDANDPIGDGKSTTTNIISPPAGKTAAAISTALAEPTRDFHSSQRGDAGNDDGQTRQNHEGGGTSSIQVIDEQATAVKGEAMSPLPTGHSRLNSEVTNPEDNHENSGGDCPVFWHTTEDQTENELEKRSPMIQTIGLKPEGCILVRDNWCGFEVPHYSDEDGCWASSEECWNQSDVCWNTAPPTGNKNCNIWQKKCTQLDDSCKSGDFDGPPHEGKDLTPTPPPLDGPITIFSRDMGRGMRRAVRRHDGHGLLG